MNSNKFFPFRWNSDDISAKDETFEIDNVKNSKTVHHLLTHLSPYTQYAYYVETMTITSESVGGKSVIAYFRTSPGTPDKVNRLRTTSNASSEIVSFFFNIFEFF